MTGENYQLIVQAVNDRITGVPGIDQSITVNALIPRDLPGLDAIIERHTHRTIAEVENRTKLDLYPRRKTNYAKTPEQIYNNREYYYTTKQSFKNQNFLDFPHWAELTVEQQQEYSNNPLLYIDGSLVWDELTNEQKTLFSRNVFFIPNKSFDEEALDGKNRRYVDLLKNRIIKIHKLYL